MRLPEHSEYRIIDIDEKGRGLIERGDTHLPIDGALPGDLAQFQVGKRLRKPQRLLRGEYAITPPCSHVEVCGGCSWQHLPYLLQLHYKERIVQRALGDVLLDGVQLHSILPADPIYHYRNKMEFTFSDMRWIDAQDIHSERIISDRRALGLHVRKRFDRIVDIQECHLQNSNEIRNELRRYAFEKDIPFYSATQRSGVLRNVLIRSNLEGQYMVVLILASPQRKDAEAIGLHLCKKFPHIVSFYTIVNPALNDAYLAYPAELLRGAAYLLERCDHISIRIYPKSFYQTNSHQAPRLYAIVRNWIHERKATIVYDLYCGAGSIGLYVLREGMKIVGIELIKEAIIAARENAEDIQARDIEFFEGKVEDLLDIPFVRAQGFPDLVIVDPPRAGLHMKVIELLMKVRPQYICYISCNPISLARDIRALSASYTLNRVHPVDMFPQTPHVEIVSELQRKPCNHLS